MEVAQFLQFLYSGMTVGSAYALAALGLLITGYLAWTAGKPSAASAHSA